MSIITIASLISLKNCNYCRAEAKSPTADKKQLTVRICVDVDDNGGKDGGGLWAHLNRTLESLLVYRSKAVNLLWRFTEIHMDKFIAFAMIHIAIKEV